MTPRRTPTIATKLAAVDHIKYEQFCRMEGRTKTEVARAAILYYMKAKETEKLDEHQAAIEKRFRRMENRLAGVLGEIRRRHLRAGASFRTRTDDEIRKKLFHECYVSGVRKMHDKLKPGGRRPKSDSWRLVA